LVNSPRLCGPVNVLPISSTRHNQRSIPYIRTGISPSDFYSVQNCSCMQPRLSFNYNTYNIFDITNHLRHM